MAGAVPPPREPEAIPDEPPAPSGPSAVLPLAAFFVLVLVIVGLVALGGWVALGFAIALLVLGVIALTRYVQRISITRRSPERLSRGVSGMNEDLSVTDDAHTELSVHDVPLDNPERRTIEERQRGA